MQLLCVTIQAKQNAPTRIDKKNRTPSFVRLIIYSEILFLLVTITLSEENNHADEMSRVIMPFLGRVTNKRETNRYDGAHQRRNNKFGY